MEAFGVAVRQSSVLSKSTGLYNFAMNPPFKRQRTHSPELQAHQRLNHTARRDYGNTGGRNHDRPHDPRNATDRPHSKHALPGYEPWMLIKTKLRRQFVHNTETKESLWHIPANIVPGVVAFGLRERERKEQHENAKKSGYPAQSISRAENKAEIPAADAERRGRRRRSESLQREDEAAMLAELAAQTEAGEASNTHLSEPAVDRTNARIAYDSEGSYDEIEVTDSEFEDEEEQPQIFRQIGAGEHGGNPEDDGEAPVEFGEDDIAYQLAAMGEDYGLDPGEYGSPGEDWEEGDEGLPLSDADAISLFRDLLDDYRVSPYTPWDALIADQSETSILHDNRYTVLPNMRARKEAWHGWTKDKAAQIQRDRLVMNKLDPKIPYLAFLDSKATPKLYWPEFKRKYKREPELNDRKLSDKDREKLYRDHITRLKLPESARKADLMNLLKSTPVKELNRETTIDGLPQKVLSHLHFISLPSSTRNPIIESHVQKLPHAPENGDMTNEQRDEDERRREERRRREQALAERERRVENDRRAIERDEARARRDLRDEERELENAMAIGNQGLHSQLRETRLDPTHVEPAP
jgi:hypothetical protein